MRRRVASLALIATAVAAVLAGAAAMLGLFEGPRPTLIGEVRGGAWNQLSGDPVEVQIVNRGPNPVRVGRPRLEAHVLGSLFLGPSIDVKVTGDGTGADGPFEGTIHFGGGTIDVGEPVSCAAGATCLLRYRVTCTTRDDDSIQWTLAVPVLPFRDSDPVNASIAVRHVTSGD